jgi:type 1 glutamine amidotransferase
MKTRHIIFIFFFIPLLLPAQKKQPYTILIVDGFSNHDWAQTTKVTRWILEESKLFNVEVSTIPLDSAAHATWLPDFGKYDVVIQNTNNINNPRLRWPLAAEQKLEEYVKNGGGLYILHSANNAFPHWKEYDNMIGMGWRSRNTGYALEINENKEIVRFAPGEGQGTGHGERFDALVQILNRHPINTGFPEKWKTANTEVYYFPRGTAENLTVLSYAYDSTTTKRMWPVEWVVQYKKGRVYNSSMGHLWKGEIYPEAYQCVGYQTTVIRAAEWLASGKVSYPIPENFPSEKDLSLRINEALISNLSKP